MKRHILEIAFYLLCNVMFFWLIAKVLIDYNSAEQKYLRCMEKETLRICVPIYRQDKYKR